MRRHWKLACIGLLMVGMAAPWIAVRWAGGEMASPPRRDLMAYHRDYLDHPDKHGIRIEHFTGSDGTPCLYVTPAGNPGERGAKIRQQLAGKNLALSPFGTIRGSMVLTHGLKGRKEDYLSIAERLCAVGFRCVIPDLPAHGDHPVDVITYGVREASLPARMLLEASKKYGFPSQAAGIMGMSMGGSVAVHAAALPDAPWRSLVVVSSFDSLPEVIEAQAAQYVGASIGPIWARSAGEWYHERTGVPLSDIQPRLRAANIPIPTLIAHGTNDAVASLAAGRRLYESLPSSTPRKWIEVPAADHHNVFITSYPIYSKIAAWLVERVLPSGDTRMKAVND